MSLVMFVLFVSGRTLLTAIIILLMAIPSGMGLGIGLHFVKRFVRWWDRRKLSTAERHAKNHKDFLSEEEAIAAGDQID